MMLEYVDGMHNIYTLLISIYFLIQQRMGDIKGMMGIMSIGVNCRGN